MQLTTNSVGIESSFQAFFAEHSINLTTSFNGRRQLLLDEGRAEKFRSHVI